MIDKETKEARPVTQFLNGEQLANDVKKITDGARSKFWSGVGMALATMRNYDPFQSPTHFKMVDLLRKFDKSFGVTGRNYGKVTGDRTIEDIQKRRADRWNFLFVAGMWFQDLFNYDFRRTEMCIIPYGTQEGEISFCAYNTGIGWRNIIEHMHQNATVAKWYEEHGRHEIFARGKEVEMADRSHNLILNEVDLARPNKPHMEGPKTAHEEMVAMRKLYQEMVMKQQQIQTDNGDKPVQIQGLNGKKSVAVVTV
jgi:uncharacterized radical SAM superfamily Fe-S cluster-containing enzyme